MNDLLTLFCGVGACASCVGIVIVFFKLLYDDNDKNA